MSVYPSSWTTCIFYPGRNHYTGVNYLFYLGRFIVIYNIGISTFYVDLEAAATEGGDAVVTESHGFIIACDSMDRNNLDHLVIDQIRHGTM